MCVCSYVSSDLHEQGACARACVQVCVSVCEYVCVLLCEL